MKKQYFPITLPVNPLEILLKLNLSTYTLLENGHSNYIIAYSRSNDHIFEINTVDCYRKLAKKNQYVFGYIPYSQKKHFLSDKESKHPAFHQFNKSTFFVPEVTLILKNNIGLLFGTEKEVKDITDLLHNNTTTLNNYQLIKRKTITLKHKTTKSHYIETVQKIKDDIQRGDIYEMNYCITAECVGKSISPIQVYHKLRNKTRAPFSALLKLNNTVVLSASPERFVNKSNNKILSQPIKGTIKRGENAKQDEDLIKQLANDKKEQAENIMIVDLVRNDLSKIALKSTVKVTELCKIYSFNTVHQLISTIEAQIPTSTDFKETLQALFPMGSMTGAPKHRATQLIEKYEDFQREIYSGSIGFISPNTSFDFNVVIRSILHNVSLQSTSISIGSAITINSNPLSEYSECLLKFSAIAAALE